MKTKPKYTSYDSYKKQVTERLAESKTWKKCGVWKRDGKITDKAYILPLEKEDNNRGNRAEAIKKYLGFDCAPYFPTGYKGLHQYAHHLNSSQILCLMFFAVMTEQKGKYRYATRHMVEFVREAFGIDIKEGAKCHFEYKQKKAPYIFEIEGKKEYEGTSFDFHIDDGVTEIFFEIKFTENGFGQADVDDHHKCKAKQYKELMPEYLRDVTTEKILKYYQLFRNIIRANAENKWVVFIIDANNPSTYKEMCEFEELIGVNLESKHILFKSWQEIATHYQQLTELPFQFKTLLELQ